MNHIRIETPRFLTQAKPEDLLIYDNQVDNNILFIGSCRLTPYMFYYNNIKNCEYKRNIYGIYVPRWSGENINNFPHAEVINILKNTDIIICESISNYGILNTHDELEINFFKEFNIDKKIDVYKIPNLELRMYHYEIIHIFKQPKESVYPYFLSSKEYLLTKLNNLGYEKVASFIDSNIGKIKLFNTFNHPSKTLSLFLFKYITAKIGIYLESSFFVEMQKYIFLEGNETPIFNIDKESYDIKFDYTYIDDNKLYEPGIFVNNTITDFDFTLISDFK